MKDYPLLKITLLDVGWGDAIFLESIDSQQNYHFAFIDSNDTKFSLTSYDFLKRYFRRHEHYIGELPDPCFDFVLLTHDHVDHLSGLRKIIQEHGSGEFWYPKSNASTLLARMLKFADRESKKSTGKIRFHEALEVGKLLDPFGDVSMEVLWPPENHNYEETSENNSSVVMKLTLGKWSVILTGDAEKEVWREIGNQIPTNTRFFKVPHHGSKNGTDPHEPSGWYKKCSRFARLGISCDLRSTTQFFPAEEVIQLFDNDKRKYFRTDLHHHVTFITDGEEYDVRYSH
ncbi:MAG: competence protein ComEC [Desulforhopalus sp.]|jgi:competence protein ComEC